MELEKYFERRRLPCAGGLAGQVTRMSQAIALIDCVLLHVERKAMMHAMSIQPKLSACSLAVPAGARAISRLSMAKFSSAVAIPSSSRFLILGDCLNIVLFYAEAALIDPAEVILSLYVPLRGGLI
jgi:hypothetical protein